MAEDELERGEAVEDAGGEELEHVEADVAVPAPAGGAEACGGRFRVGRRRRARERFGHARGREGWVQVDGHVQLGCCRPEGVVFGRVEVLSVGVVVDQRADEAELLHTPVQLGGACSCVCHRKDGKGGKASRLTDSSDCMREFVVAPLAISRTRASYLVCQEFRV